MVLAGRTHSNPQLTEEQTYLGTLAMVRRGQVGCQKCRFLSLCLLLPLITGASGRLWECGEQAPPWVRGAQSQSRCSPNPQPSQQDHPAGHKSAATLHDSCRWTELGSRSVGCPLQRPYHFQPPGGSPQQSARSVPGSGP